MSKTRLFVLIALLLLVALVTTGIATHVVLRGGSFRLPHGLGKIG